MGAGLDMELNEREKSILQSIVQLYILKASPIGSRNLAKYLQGQLNLSPATIRNTMADLEEMELISHPHTSAGRIPTDKGYRIYVDYLMKMEDLTVNEMNTVRENLLSGSSANVFKDASKILGLLSHYLSIVAIPDIRDLVVLKIDLIELSSSKILVVIALDSNNVKTVTLEADFEINYLYLPEICTYINEKVSGRPLKFIRDNFLDLISDFHHRDNILIRLFVDSVDKIFRYSSSEDKLFIAGTQNLLQHPEFGDLEKVKTVIEIIENEDVIIHLLDNPEKNVERGIRVFIGSEMQSDLLDDYSLVISTYRIGSADGSIGLIGPKRMNYSKMMSLVSHVSQILSKKS